MNKKYRVQLGGTDRARVAEILNGAETSPRYRKRANVLLMADESVGKPMTQEEIAVRCGVCDVTVYHTGSVHFTLDRLAGLCFPSGLAGQPVSEEYLKLRMDRTEPVQNFL